MNKKDSALGKKPNQQKYLYLIGLLFIFCSATLVGFALSEEKLNLNREGQSDFSSYQPNRDIDLVNRHMTKTASDLEFEKMKSLAESLKTAKPLSETQAQKSVDNEGNFFDFEGDPRLRQLAEDMGRANDVKKVNGNDPQNQVYESMFKDKAKKEYEEEQRRAQARDFVARARKDGWIVQLDENLKIKSYRHVDEAKPDENAEKFKGYDPFPSK